MSPSRYILIALLLATLSIVPAPVPAQSGGIVIADIAYAPGVEQMDPLVINVTLRNDGATPVQGPVSVHLSILGQGIGDVVFSDIAPGAEVTMNTTWTPSKDYVTGLYYITASYGGSQFVSAQALAVTRYRHPAFTLEFIEDGYHDDRGEDAFFDIKFSVANTGTADAGPVNVTIVDDEGKVYAGETLPSLAVGESRDITLKIKVKGGTYSRIYAFASTWFEGEEYKDRSDRYARVDTHEPSCFSAVFIGLGVVAIFLLSGKRPLPSI